MNRYASGYKMISLISVIGFFAIAISVVGGIIIGSNAPRGLGYVGFVIVIAGSFQGLLLLVVGVIGQAILDGSNAQQDALSAIKELAKSLRYKSDSKPESTEYPMRPPSPGFAKINQDMADEIIRSDERLR